MVDQLCVIFELFKMREGDKRRGLFGYWMSLLWVLVLRSVCSLNADEVLCTDFRSNCLWLCKLCLFLSSEAKFSNQFVKNIDKKVTSSLKQLLTKILFDAVPTALTENVQKAVIDSLPSYRDALQKDSTQVEQSTALQFFITGVPENES